MASAPTDLRLRSSWAYQASRQAKAAQEVGDHNAAALFLALVKGLADATVADMRRERAQ